MTVEEIIKGMQLTIKNSGLIAEPKKVELLTEIDSLNKALEQVILGLPSVMCSCKEKQRQALIDMMQADEESGMYED